MKKLGRPLQREEAKRAALSFRTTPKIKRLIEQAAAENGRSISQEAEFRLELSFRDEPWRRLFSSDLRVTAYPMSSTSFAVAVLGPCSIGCPLCAGRVLHVESYCEAHRPFAESVEASLGGD